MTWHGWFNADPFWVHLQRDGTLQVLLGSRTVFCGDLTVVVVDEAGGERKVQPHHLMVLRGNDRLPPFSPCSWVNQRGRGQIVLSGPTFISCRLHGRMPGPPDVCVDGEPDRERMRHPGAGFWLGLAADLADTFTLDDLQRLTGYSYPSVREWSRRQVTIGHLHVRFSGRTQHFMAVQRGRSAWWQDVRRWWPIWRRPAWPKHHGPAVVHWARWSQRLPEHIVRVPEPPAPLCPLAPADWVWATGADHLTATGKLIQSFDSDVWMSASAWEIHRHAAKIMVAPPNAHEWSGTRVSVVADHHPLLRMLIARIGSHRTPSPERSPSLRDTPVTGALIDGLPLVDAVASPDARVVEQGRTALTAFESAFLLP